jgi:hypothetical protein
MQSMMNQVRLILQIEHWKECKLTNSTSNMLVISQLFLSVRGSFERTAAQLFLDMKFAVYELSKENANALDE